MTGLSIAFTLAFLCVPSYYETRFLLPLVPTVAVLLAWIVAASVRDSGTAWKWLAHVLVFATLAYSFVWVYRANLHPPVVYWDAKEILERLATYHVKRIGNIGNSADWNCSKLRMIGRTNRASAACEYVEISRLREDDAARETAACDAVFVLDYEAIPKGYLQYAPGQNRGYTAAVRALKHGFKELPVRELTEGNVLPKMRLFIRNESRQGEVPGESR